MCVSKWLKHTKPEEECLVWIRCFNTDGYPRAGNANTSNLKVHREVFYEVNGYYPEVVRHTCDNIRCVNPEHLLGGTWEDNVKDRGERGRTFRHVSEEEVTLCEESRQKGLTYKEIGNLLNMNPKRVEYILTRLRKAG